MALTGSYVHYTYEQHPTETVSYIVTYPESLPEGHDNYDLRGTSETLYHPTQVEVTQSFDDCYITVRTSCVTTQTDRVGDNPKVLEHSAFWRVYNSEAEKLANEDSHLLEVYMSKDWDWDTQSNPVSEAYNHIKELQGAENLRDV